jgi:D-alanyl-D-alanine carboxypeptidase/D-alanyl-D-alanine-endopeptidase (penicillin-binding protein 4)
MRSGFAHRRAGAACAVVLLAIAAAAAQGPAPAAPTTPLAARLDVLLDAPEFRAARWGVHAVALDTGEVLYSRDAERRFLPASNLKLYTTALALARLGPQYRWRTSVYSATRPDRRGRISGDLVLYGRGDPTISGRFAGGDPLARVDQLAERIAASGVRRVAGDLVADESYFTGPRLGHGWEWDDLQWGYGAEVSALSVDDNAVTIEVAPAARPGLPCQITVRPATGHVRVINRTRTSPKGGVSDLGIYRAEGSNTFDVWGHLPAGADAFTADLAVHDPAAFFGELLRGALERRGVAIAGRVRSVDARARERLAFAPESAVEIAHLESEPLADVVRETNKESQNLYAELLLRSVGRAVGPKEAKSADAAGVAALVEYLGEAGVDTTTVAVFDGSGLSRHNLVTPTATVRLLAHVRSQPYAGAFTASLPEAAADGTLARRFADTAAIGRVRAKTGTLADVSALAGYLTTRSGRPVAFAVMVNNAPASASLLRKTIDAVVLEILAE